MTQPAADVLTTRVLVLAPTAKDADVTSSLLKRAGMNAVICEDVRCLIEDMQIGGGAIITTEEGITGEGTGEMFELLDRQPPWSKIPIVILMREAREPSARTRIIQALENVTLLERPAAMRTVISAVQSALRERQRQYQIRDQISEIERLLASEQGARAEAERASRAKDEFLATVSHELRTPLSAILLWTRMLQTGTLKEGDLDEAIGAISRSAEAQRQLIGDLLDMARMMSGKVRLQLRDIQLGPVISAAVDAIRPTAAMKSVTLRASIADDIGTVRCDPDRIQQVVWNLLSNALKFTPSGGEVEVTLSRPGHTARITVRDTGQGIGPDFLPHVFERFRQADGSMTRAHGGLGLGLAIVRELVELHGGKVYAQSDGANHGATFTVELPLIQHSSADDADVPPSTATPRLNGRPLAGVQVLLVEDEPETRKALRTVLESSGARVDAVACADAAFENLRRAEPDVLVSDIGLPGEDGYSLMRRLGKLAKDRGLPVVPAIALTAYARVEDRERALAAGFQAYASKPVEPDQLVRTIVTLSGRSDS